MIGHDEAARLARIVLDLRSKRADHLPAELFGEHAWGILLAMFVADADGERLTVADACARAGRPTAVAMRWLRVLREHGLVACEDPCDSSRLVTLTATGIGAIEACMEDAQSRMVSRAGGGGCAAVSGTAAR